MHNHGVSLSSGSKILVQRADRLGDVVFSLPVIEQLKQLYPHTEIHVLTSPIGRKFLEPHPLITKIITIDLTKPRTSRDQRELLQTLRRENYTLYISLWNHPTLAAIGLQARIPYCIGDGTNFPRRLYYNFPVRQRWEDFTRHQIDFNLDLLEPLRPCPLKPVLKIYTDKEADKQAKKWSEELGGRQRKTIVIFCGTGGTNFPIPETAVRDFSLKITATNRFNVILCGEKKQGSLLNGISHPNLLNIIGKTSLNELVSMINLADYYVGPDTGPTQIASFLQKPMIFFSPIRPNPPSRWGPQTPYFQIIRRDYDMPVINATTMTNPDFSYVTGDYLYDHFCELLRRKELNDDMSAEQQEQVRLLHSYRVLVIVRSKEEYDRVQLALTPLREQGLVVFPYIVTSLSVSSVRRLLNYIARRNINVIQGKIPSWLVWIIRFYVGAVKAYIPPVYIPLILSAQLQLNDYIRLYNQKWQQKTPK